MFSAMLVGALHLLLNMLKLDLNRTGKKKHNFAHLYTPAKTRAKGMSLAMKLLR